MNAQTKGGITVTGIVSKIEAGSANTLVVTNGWVGIGMVPSQGLDSGAGENPFGCKSAGCNNAIVTHPSGAMKTVIILFLLSLFACPAQFWVKIEQTTNVNYPMMVTVIDTNQDWPMFWLLRSDYSFTNFDSYYRVYSNEGCYVSTKPQTSFFQATPLTDASSPPKGEERPVITRIDLVIAPPWTNQTNNTR